MKERSKIILNGKLEVTNTGRVFRIKNDSKEEASINYATRNKKYAIVSIYENGKQKHLYVHRLVAKAFLPNPNNKPQVNHIDGNPKNNNASNLEWVTGSENMIHAYRTGLVNPQEQQPKCISCKSNIVHIKNTICKECRDKAKKELFDIKKNKIIDNLLFSKNNLTEYQREILGCRKNNLTVKEIAELRGCTHQSVSQTLRNVKKRYNIKEKI